MFMVNSCRGNYEIPRTRLVSEESSRGNSSRFIVEEDPNLADGSSKLNFANLQNLNF